jgi:hypothetical protein
VINRHTSRDQQITLLASSTLSVLPPFRHPLPSSGYGNLKSPRTYIWGSAKYTSSKFYTLSFATIQAPTPFKWIWQSKVSKKIKIFIWLLCRDRINSRNLLRRKNYKIEGDDYSCVLCNLDTKELSYHLIF